MNEKIKYEFNPIVRSLLVTVFVVCLCIATAITTLLRNPSDALLGKEFRAQIGPYAIEFYTNKKTEPLFRVSALDDFYYIGSSEDHIIDNVADFQNDSVFFNELNMLVSNIVSQNKLLWAIVGQNHKKTVKIAYEVEKKEDGWIEITRKLTTNQYGVYAVGKSITFCSNCMLKDNNNQIYFATSLLQQEKIETANRLKLTPFIIDRKLPLHISELFVIDPKGNTQLDLPIDKKEEIYFDEQWHLLEIKTFIPEGEAIVVRQRIKF